MSALAVLRLAREAKPGQRYRHGWVPVSPQALLPAESVDEEHGRQLDAVEFGDNGRIVAREHGVTVESDSGSDIAIHATPSPVEAGRWADAIEQRETFTRASFATEPYEGGMSVRFGDLETELDDADAQDVAQALRDMSYVAEDVEPADSDVNLDAFATEARRVLELYDDEGHPRGDKGTTTGGQFVKNDNGTPTKQQPQKQAPQKKITPKQRRTSQKPPAKKIAKKPGSTTKSGRRRIRRTQLGDSGPKTAQLQSALRTLDLRDSHGRRIKLDGKFGPATQQAVMAAQEKLGIKPTGEVTAGFLKKLSDAAELSPCAKRESVDVLEADEYEAETDESETDDDEVEEQTGAMIALVPSEADAKRLAVEDGELPEDLHLTLGYLGEASDFDDAGMRAVIDAVTEAFSAVAPVESEVFAVAILNPGSDDECLCALAGGDAVMEARKAAVSVLNEIEDLPPQLLPYLAHITLAYTDDPSLVEEYVDRVGPVAFDRVRVAFAGDVTDIPLGAQDRTETSTEAVWKVRITGSQADVDNFMATRATEAVNVTALALIRRAREAFNPDQRRAPKGTGIGGRWVNMGAVIAALRGAGHERAAVDVETKLGTPRHSRPASSGMGRVMSADQIRRGQAKHEATKVKAEKLRARIGVAEDRLHGRHAAGDPLLDPENRKKARADIAEMKSELEPLDADIAAHEDMIRDHEMVHGESPLQSNPLEDAARTRQAKADTARGVAETLTELDELSSNAASPRAMETRLRAQGKLSKVDPATLDALVQAGVSGDRVQVDAAIDRIAAQHGLRRTTGPAGSSATFDRTVHQPIGKAIGDGVAVDIIRPGYEADIDGERITVHRAVVQTAAPKDVAYPVTLGPGSVIDAPPPSALDRLPDLSPRPLPGTPDGGEAKTAPKTKAARAAAAQADVRAFLDEMIREGEGIPRFDEKTGGRGSIREILEGAKGWAKSRDDLKDVMGSFSRRFGTGRDQGGVDIHSGPREDAALAGYLRRWFQRWSEGPTDAPPSPAVKKVAAGRAAAALSTRQWDALHLLDFNGGSAPAGHFSPATLGALERDGLVRREGADVAFTDEGRRAFTDRAPVDAVAIAAQIGQLGTEQEILDALASQTPATIRRIAKNLGAVVPPGRLTPERLREQIARQVVRDRGRFHWRPAERGPDEPAKLRAPSPSPTKRAPRAPKVTEPANTVAGILIDPEAPDYDHLVAIRDARTVADLRQIAKANNVRLPSHLKAKEDIRHYVARELSYNPGEDFDAYKARTSAPSPSPAVAKVAAARKAPKAPRPSGLPTDRRPEPGDYDDLAERVAGKTAAQILEMIQDLNAAELARLARKFPGQGASSSIMGVNRDQGLRIPAGLTTEEKRAWLAKTLGPARPRFTWR